MKNNILIKVAVVLIAIGVILTYAGSKDSMLILTGDKVRLSETSQSDFHEPKMIEGDVFMIQSMMDTEQSYKRFGFIRQSKHTEYYLIVNCTREDWKNAVETGRLGSLKQAFYVIYAVTDKDMIEKCNAAAAEYDKYYNELVAGNIDADIPDIKLSFEGVTAEQRSDSKYTSGLENWLKGSGIEKSDVAEYMIYDGKADSAALALFFGGIALMIISIAVIIISAIKANSAAKRDELW